MGYINVVKETMLNNMAVIRTLDDACLARSFHGHPSVIVTFWQIPNQPQLDFPNSCECQETNDKGRSGHQFVDVNQPKVVLIHGTPKEHQLT